MASQLDPLKPKRILDIGCGVGNGVLALLKRFSPTIVSLEENADCIDATCEAVADSGQTVAGIFRLYYEELEDGSHNILIDQGEMVMTRKVTVVHTDVLLDDPAAIAMLDAQAPFDAVTVWLMGTFKMRQTCRNISNLVMENSGDYRLHVQNRVYALADRILRPGGWLHIVDRGEIPSELALRDDLINSHREQALDTRLEFFDLAHRGYEESREGIRLVITPGTSGTTKESIDNLGMISIISRLPPASV